MLEALIVSINFASEIRKHTILLAAETQGNAAQFAHILSIISCRSETACAVFAAILRIAYKERNVRQTCATHEDFLII
jgi:hypothetical protein